MAYDSNNVFAKILRGDLPAQKVYEDAETLAFMDIMPRCEGHTLVIPKTPARNILDASPAQLAACMRTVSKVANAAMKAFDADGITLQQFNEPAGGQVVFHLHFHVLPRMEGVSLGPPASKMEKPEVLAAAAERIRKAMAA
ncbi:MAG TPA: HIT family protein [Hyphomicrobiaceae bacterium]|jgi:histidine triad (HIT) family protein|nr:HIT family protein [Hyphomicrobiaceae bacterium]